MILKEQLKLDLKTAMKSKDVVRRDIIRLVLSEVSAEDSWGKAGSYLDDAGIQGVIKKVKKNLDSIPEDAKTDDLKKEIEILSSYLPEIISEEKTKEIVLGIISEVEATSMRDIGKVMGKVNSLYKGKIDNKLVSEIVKEKLS